MILISQDCMAPLIRKKWNRVNIIKIQQFRTQRLQRGEIGVLENHKDSHNTDLSWILSSNKSSWCYHKETLCHFWNSFNLLPQCRHSRGSFGSLQFWLVVPLLSNYQLDYKSFLSANVQQDVAGLTITHWKQGQVFWLF